MVHSRLARVDSLVAAVWTRSLHPVNHRRATATHALGRTIVALTLCLMAGRAHADTCVWSQRIGGAGIDGVRAVAVAPNDESIAAGTFDKAMTVGSTTLANAGALDGFVTALSATNGSPSWAQRFSGTGDDDVQRVAVDGSGNVYAAGTFSLTASLAGQSETALGPSDVFVAKLSRTGARIWVKTLGGLVSDSTPRIAVTDNEAYVAWTGVGNIMCGSSVNGIGLADLFIAKLNPATGAVVACKAFGGPNDEALAGIAINPATGHLIVVANFDHVTNLGGGSTSVPGALLYDFSIAIYDANLSFINGRVVGGTGYDLAAAVAVVGTDVAVVGSFGAGGPLDFGGGPVALKTGYDGFVARYGLETLDYHAGAGVGGNGDDALRDVAVLGSQVAAVGDFSGVADFGTGNLNGNGRDAVALVGPGIWSVRYGSYANDKGFASATRGGTALTLGGSYSTPMMPPDFGCGALPSAQGPSDGWVARLIPSLTAPPATVAPDIPTPVVPTLTPTRSATALPATATATRAPGTPVPPTPTPFVDIEVPFGMPWRVRTKAP